MKDKIYRFVNEKRYNNDSGELCNLLELGEYSIGPLGFVLGSLLLYGAMVVIFYSNEKSQPESFTEHSGLEEKLLEK